MGKIKGIKRELKEYIARGENTLPRLIALAKKCRAEGRREDYLYLLQVLEREEIADNLKEHMAEELGAEAGDTIFRGLKLPPRGAAPEEALAYVEHLLENLAAWNNRREQAFSEKKLHAALAGNAHGIPPEAFEKEKLHFEKAPSLEAYLKDSHERAVETLAEHAETGEVWFEQIITREVVEFVRPRREILGGRLEGEKIYVTKIPYRPDEWLRETDPRRKAYLACHCPMARASLGKGRTPVDSLWCACSAGFAKQKFEALFGERVETEVVSSVLRGDPMCRFSLTVPSRFIN